MYVLEIRTALKNELLLFQYQDKAVEIAIQKCTSLVSPSVVRQCLLHLKNGNPTYAIDLLNRTFRELRTPEVVFLKDYSVNTEKYFSSALQRFSNSVSQKASTLYHRVVG